MRETSLCQQGPKRGLLIEPEAMLKMGATNGAPRGKQTEHQSARVAQHPTQLAKFDERMCRYASTIANKKVMLRKKPTTPSTD